CGGQALTGPTAALRSLLDDLGYATRADGAATLTDRELQAFLHGDRLDELDAHLGVVARHHHLGALGELDHAGHVRGAEVELRAVAVEERRVPAALVLGEDVDLRLELGVRRGRTRLDDTHTALDLVALDTPEQERRVVTGVTLVEGLVEHLDAGDGGGQALVPDTDDLDGVVDLDDTALDTAGDDGTPTGDREDVLDRHEERLVDLTLRLGDVLVHRVHQLDDRFGPRAAALERLEGRDADDRHLVAREALRAEQLTDLELDQLQDLLVVDHVGLVQGDDDVRHADLAGEKDVLLGLRHRAVGRGDHEDGAVHLGGTGDQVLHVVGVTGAVDVRVVALLRLVLDVRDRRSEEHTSELQSREK